MGRSSVLGDKWYYPFGIAGYSERPNSGAFVGDVEGLHEVDASFQIGCAPIQRVANAEGELLQRNRFLNELDIEIDAALVNDGVA